MEAAQPRTRGGTVHRPARRLRRQQKPATRRLEHQPQTRLRRAPGRRHADGYFPNLTHGSAIVGVQKGYFKDALAKDGATLKTQLFTSGSDTLEALAGGSLDATYIGPSPAITAFAQSHGDLVRIVSGATEGGASLMVNPSITSIADLKGKKIATPSAGNTQDVALKYFLKQHGFKESADGTGDVTVVNQDNGTTCRPSRRARSTAPGSPSPTPPSWRRPAPSASSTRRRCGRGQVRHDRAAGPQPSSNNNPTCVDDLLKGQVRRTTTSQELHGRREGRR